MSLAERWQRPANWSSNWSNWSNWPTENMWSSPWQTNGMWNGATWAGNSWGNWGNTAWPATPSTETASKSGWSGGWNNWNGWNTPRVDLKETEKEVILTADLPGWEKKDIHVSLENNILMLRGERKWEERKNGETWHCNERAWTHFERAWPLPDKWVDKEKISAKFENGVLSVWLTKWPEAQKEVRKIDIK